MSAEAGVVLDRRIRLAAGKVLLALKLPQPMEAVGRHIVAVASMVGGMTVSEAPALGPGNPRLAALIEARDALDAIIAAMQAGEEYE